MTSKNKELTASLYALGTELLIGGKIDTNCDFIAKHLTQLGIKVRRRYTIGDNLSELIEAFKLGLEDDIIISSGGLGPTIDDITREALSAVTGIGFRYDKKLLKAIEDRFKARDMEMPANNKLQAQAPIEGGYFPNKNGTAPAIYFELPNSNKVAIALPGPPREMIPIMEKDVVSYLKAKFNIAKRQEKCNIRISGLTESQVDVFLRNIFGQENKDIDLTILSDPGLVDIYLTWKGKDKEAKKGLEFYIDKLKNAFGDNIYGFDGIDLSEVVGDMLRKNNLKISVAESCTGGGIGARITSVSGSSDYFQGGIIAYSNHIKESLLGVGKDILETYGAVSSECASSMAAGVRKFFNTDIGISCTGIAGPSGGLKNKPVGLVFIGISFGDNILETRELKLPGGRNIVRERAIISALDILRRTLTKKYQEYKNK